ncbi:MAG TPA: carboxypeptidase-like regulatory domain-containing protein [Candidatus Acidoferrales bacterium]|nr:carboxypeptidase-like regulatory domain-containing protein [Candidatus Acidoferrales bacterium]
MTLPMGLSAFFGPPCQSPARVARFSQIILLSSLAISLAVPARAQEGKGEAQLRTVHGTVIDKDDNPVASSVVYLLNVKTQSIITRITDGSGAYRFSGLDPNVDYEVHAEHNDLTSSTRTVSSFDTRRDIEVVLKLSRKKSGQ